MRLLPRISPPFALSLSLSLALALSACGGSGDEAPVTAKLEDRYAPFLGHWVACYDRGSGMSAQDDLRVTEAGGNKVRVARTNNEYSGPGCTGGTPRLFENEESVVTLLGETTTVSGVPLEKFTRIGEITRYVAGTAGPITLPAPAKGAAGVVVSGSTTTLRVGDDKPVDAQGYPATLRPFGYEKRP